MHADDRPVDQRPPSADLMLVPDDRPFRRFGVALCGREGALRERPLLGRGMSDGVLRYMAANGVDRMTERAGGNGNRYGGRHKCDKEELDATWGDG
jgi:hypothetical protein